MKQKTTLTIITGLLIAGIIIFFAMNTKKSDVVSVVTPDIVLTTKETEATTTPVVPSPITRPSPTSVAPVPVKKNYMYKDGTYSAIGEYMSPGGPETIQVSLVIKDEKVMGATVVGDAQNSISKRLQEDFISNYKQYVIGKKISDISLSKVSGSSLTPKGFNDALVKIKAQAKA